MNPDMTGWLGIDLEATGVAPDKDRIIEVGLAHFEPIGNRIQIKTKSQLINPGVPIPKVVTDLTKTDTHPEGITDGAVANAPAFAEIATALHERMQQATAIVVFNGYQYDCPLLWYEFRRAGINWDYTKANIIDVCGIDRILTRHNLASVYKRWTGSELEEAHRAGDDAAATMAILAKMMGGDVPADPAELALYSNWGKKLIDISGKFSRNDNGQITFGFGKHEGKVADMEPGYLTWMLENDFPEDTKMVARRILRGDLR